MTVKEIQLSQSDDWYIHSNFINKNKRVTLITQVGKTNSKQNGNKVQLVLPQNFSYSSLSLEMRGNKFYIQKLYTEIPTKIDLFNPEILFDASNIEFDYSVEDEFDFITLNYLLIVNNYGSYWTIFQRADAVPNYKLPVIPENVLNDFLLVKKGLEQQMPWVTISAYDIHSGESFFKEHSMNFDGCSEYSVKKNR